MMLFFAEAPAIEKLHKFGNLDFGFAARAARQKAGALGGTKHYINHEQKWEETNSNLGGGGGIAE